LEAEGFELRVASDGQAAIEQFVASKPDLVITDLAMPSVDGIELCGKIRAISQVPVLVLSVKGDESVKVRALDAGADDYVTKPFGIQELLARVRALLRRAEADNPSTARETYTVGDFSVDALSRRIQVAGKTLQLTPKEYDLLLYLLAHPSRVITHEKLLTAVWGKHSGQQTEYLRVFVGQLRKKIETDPRNPKYLKTEPWIGYRFDPS